MKNLRKTIFTFLLICLLMPVFAARILIPMDNIQTNHLKAYGIAYWTLTTGIQIEWLLNYRGGSFVLPFNDVFEKECKLRNVNYEIIADVQYQKIINDISRPDENMEVVKLEKAPKIAVYAPKTKQPWDDAVTLVLKYAEIPYEVVYDDEVLQNKLHLYDWLHLHHEDFTGQQGKFWFSQQNQPWYQQEKRENEEVAKRWGYPKVSQLKLAVVKKIREYVSGGGYLFAMCSAADSYDIALAADGVDICTAEFDGDPIDPKAEDKLNFNNCFAFKDFHLVTHPYQYEFSDIDATTDYGANSENSDIFTLFNFSAKWDVVPTILTQDHVRVIKGFMGQTTSFRNKFIKTNVLVLGETKSMENARYIHGEFGRGMWTFLGGHDPEDYQHLVGDPPTDLSLFPNSPGYRLILNNVLFPAAKKKERKT